MHECRAICLTILAATICISGCAPTYVRVRDAPFDQVAVRLKEQNRSRHEPGTLTQTFLSEHGITCDHGRNCGCVIESVRQIEARQPSSRGQFALAELRYLAASSCVDKKPATASELYFDAAAAAYRVITQLHHDPERTVNFESATLQLYNSSVEGLLRLASDDGKFEPGYIIQLPISGRDLSINVRETGTGWHARDFDRFEFASDYDIKDVLTRHGQLGLGVPLIAVRQVDARRREVEDHYAVGLRFPCTAVLRFDSAGTTARLELHDSMKATTVEIGTGGFPLSADLTTPLARSLDRVDLRYLDTTGLILPAKVEEVSGLYMIQPFQPGKIPVLMVHGLWSSPLTWMEMINELQSVPEIRDRYQFWFYLYPTAKPFWSASADLRRDLADMREVFDPGMDNTALDQMVVVGHSMGGLIARMLTIDSGDEFWHAMHNCRSVGGKRQSVEELRRSLFFEADDSVKRVVTIATPNRGSNYANRFTSWIARTAFSLPGRILGGVRDFAEGDVKPRESFSRQLFFTSVDSLDPTSPVLTQLRNAPKPPHVTYHNIVGRKKSYILKERKTDGIVPVASAHMDDVVSEITVEATHSKVHRAKRAICEVQRILIEHLHALPWDGVNSPVIESTETNWMHMGPATRPVPRLNHAYP